MSGPREVIIRNRFDRLAKVVMLIWQDASAAASLEPFIVGLLLSRLLHPDTALADRMV
jgi:hypothetical protein